MALNLALLPVTPRCCGVNEDCFHPKKEIAHIWTKTFPLGRKDPIEVENFPAMKTAGTDSFIRAAKESCCAFDQ